MIKSDHLIYMRLLVTIPWLTSDPLHIFPSFIFVTILYDGINGIGNCIGNLEMDLPDIHMLLITLMNQIVQLNYVF